MRIKGRPLTTRTKADTPLARVIHQRGYNVAFVSRGTGIDLTTLADYVNGRPARGNADGSHTHHKHGNNDNSISPRHLARLCAFLKCEPEDIQHT